MKEMLANNNSPIFVISDLHLGSGSSRDQFADPAKKRLLFEFLKVVEQEGGQLVVLGDLLDLWRFSLKGIVHAHSDVFDKMYEMGSLYIPGNHDSAIAVLGPTHKMPHPFLNTASMPVKQQFAGKSIAFLHGHELDTINRNIGLSVGKALGISAMPIEHVKKCQIFNSEDIDECVLRIKAGIITFLERLQKQFMGFWADMQNPIPYHDIVALMKYDKSRKKLLSFHREKQRCAHDIVISAHTHHAGRFSDWYFNSGSWTSLKQNFLKIIPDGDVEVCDWTSKGSVEIESVLA